MHVTQDGQRICELNELLPKLHGWLLIKILTCLKVFIWRDKSKKVWKPGDKIQFFVVEFWWTLMRKNIVR